MNFGILFNFYTEIVIIIQQKQARGQKDGQVFYENPT